MKKNLTIFVIFALFYNCGKDCTDSSNPECPIYNPCLAMKPYTADFYCSGTNRWNQNFDTIPLEYRIQEGYVLGDHGAKFVSTQAGVKHYWYLNGYNFSDSFFYLVFDQKDVGHQFEVVHIIEYPISESYKKCYPKATGRDTIKKKFTIESGRTWDLPIWGKYKGYLDIYPDREITIEIVPGTRPSDYDLTTGDSIPHFVIKNIDGNNKVEMRDYVVSLYGHLKYLYIADKGYPFIYLKKDGTIFYRDFPITDWNNNGNYNDDPRPNYFKGKRVN